MASIVVYGSLINPQQLDRSLNLASEACPVLVKGYRRSFNQEPAWRKGDGKYRAVLSVTKSEGDCFNGLLVEMSDDFNALDERERGYERVLIAKSQLSYLTEIVEESYSEPTYLYVGNLIRQNRDILPNRSYLDLCLRGARYWGEAFYQQFLQTTTVGQGTLEAFLQGR